MARPRKPLLNRARIVGCALALVDAEGLDAVSTRRLATELGVSGPSLYNHFRTKDEILDAVADTVCAQVDLSMFEDGTPWREALLGWARSYHTLSVPWITTTRSGTPERTRNSGKRTGRLHVIDAPSPDSYGHTEEYETAGAER